MGGLRGEAAFSIMVDEVGIRYAVCGDLRLRTLCHAIFARRGGMIVPVAVKASGAVHRGGRAITQADTLGTMTPADRWRAACILRRLHLHNLQNVSQAMLDLHLGIETADAGIEDIALEMVTLVDEAARIDVDARRILFDLSDMVTRDPAAYAECRAVIGRTGARVAIGADAMEAISEPNGSQPDLVRLPAAWLQVLCRDPASARILATMTASLRRRGIAVQGEGIVSASHLRLAVEAKLDLMQGALLADPAPAGAVFDDEARPLAGLLGGANVQALFAR